MLVGSVIQVRSFSEYIVKAPVEQDDGYMPVNNIQAGTFVSIESDSGKTIGIVMDVQHNVKEDYLPFLSGDKQDIFLPYSSDYRNSYLIIKGIGNIIDGKSEQRLIFAPGINDTVCILEDNDIRSYHLTPEGDPVFKYYKKLSTEADGRTLIGAIEKMIKAMPECEPQLKALKKFTENNL